MTKTPTPTDKSEKQRDNIKKRHQNFDYTTIADRLRTVSWSNRSHPTGVVKPDKERSTFPLTAKVMLSIVHGTIDISIIQTDFHNDGNMLKANQKSNETFLYNMTILK